MNLPRVILLSIFVSTGLSQAQEKTWPEVEKFAKAITGITWNLRGTNTLKNLRFDGENFHSTTPTGESRSQFKEHAFVDAGVFQLVFSEARSAWYFVSDDLKLITPANVSGEIEFKVENTAAAKPVVSFPQDIQNIVWVGGNERTQLKLRWNGETLEVGAKTKAWEVQKVKPVVANRRVFEFVHEGDVIWIAFSQDGTEAWWLMVGDVFGGHASSTLKTSALDVKTTGLTPQQNDLANHAEDLVKAGDKMRATTLWRELERKNAANKEAFTKLQQRFKPLAP